MVFLKIFLKKKNLITNPSMPGSVMCVSFSLTEVFLYCTIAPDKAAYSVFTQLLGPKSAIKLISVLIKILDTQFRTFHSLLRYSIRFVIAVIAYNTSNCWVHIYTWRGTKSSILNCKPVKEHSQGIFCPSLGAEFRPYSQLKVAAFFPIPCLF